TDPHSQPDRARRPIARPVAQWPRAGPRGSRQPPAIAQLDAAPQAGRGRLAVSQHPQRYPPRPGDDLYPRYRADVWRNRLPARLFLGRSLSARLQALVRADAGRVSPCPPTERGDVLNGALQNAPMTTLAPDCCTPPQPHWPLPQPLPGAYLVTTRFDAARLHADDFARCEIPAVPGASKRQCEYLAGRLCARHALWQLTGHASVPAVGEDRAPQWPAGIVGSITHSAGHAAALVAHAEHWRGLGLDLERLLSAERSQRLAKEILTNDEQLRLQQLDPALHPWLISLTFS